MSEPSFEFEKYLIVPEITIVSSTEATPAPPAPALPDPSAGPAANDGSPADGRNPKPEVIKVPKVGGGEIALYVSEVEDGWLLLDYAEETYWKESSEEKAEKNDPTECGVSTRLKKDNMNEVVIAANNNADEGRTK
ncbi:hypothetical protein QFC24_001028 [Naganishia onofrii]|uniref:Uncharacterized protein n=1 Tax=Naganishia onofrii TaxID=1851511 RepID=A0ACC2XUS2_9TREE|nr:hypothetical protein QFC24_001028 [Naganishia onofrii]